MAPSRQCVRHALTSLWERTSCCYGKMCRGLRWLRGPWQGKHVGVEPFVAVCSADGELEQLGPVGVVGGHAGLVLLSGQLEVRRRI